MTALHETRRESRAPLRPGARGAAFVMLLGLMVAAPVPTAGAPQLPEYLIKAAYLYNFAMFVEWPSDAFATADAPVVIGVVGSDPFGSALDSTVQDKRINRRRLTIERLQRNQDFTHCHILFIGSSDKARTGEVTQRLDRLPVLTVGDDAPDAAGRGATISFTVDDNRYGSRSTRTPPSGRVSSSGPGCSSWRLTSRDRSDALGISPAAIAR